MVRRIDNSTCLENLAVGKRGRLVVYVGMMLWHKGKHIPNAEGMMGRIRAVERVSWRATVLMSQLAIC